MNNDKTVCMYDGKRMTVTEYLNKPGVKSFESQLRKLAYESALCNSDGTGVDGSDLYPPLREGFPTHPNRRCTYFETHVLPMDKNLEADYWNVFQGGKVSQSVMTGTCKRCGQSFTKRSSNQVYCDSCREYQDKERKREYYHRTKSE